MGDEIRAIENFAISGTPLSAMPQLIRAQES
jgi:aspartate ammonia-lyase